jgi:hypothetical protein
MHGLTLLKLQVLLVQVVEVQLRDVELVEVEAPVEVELTVTDASQESRWRSLELVSEEVLEHGMNSNSKENSPPRKQI